jgi:GNAT superfamily N-acetyltransferase
MIGTSTLITSLENYMFLASNRAPGLVPIAFEGLRGHRSSIPKPLTNLVGAAAPNVTLPDASIDAVFDEFSRRNLPFSWLLGPHSPRGMGQRLERRGLNSFQRLSGLASCELGPTRPNSTNARIREARFDEQQSFADVLLATFELEPEVVTFFQQTYWFGSTLRARNYLAFLDGQREPVAVASSVYDPHAPIVILAIAAVRANFRGRGLYRALVEHRLADAKADGCVAAVVQALPMSSARICCRLGFREVCTQELLCLGE